VGNISGIRIKLISLIDKARSRSMILSRAEAIAVFITIFLISSSIFFTYYICNSSSLELNDKISNIIFLITCLGSLLAATFFIMNYVIVKDTFIKSLEPILLVQVVSEVGPDGHATGVAIIHYINPTNNPFIDLRISCQICFWTPCIDYSFIFSKNMYMGPHDSRNRRFNFIDDLKKKGYNIEEILSLGKEMRLQLSYTYTFYGKKKRIDIQQYKWNSRINQWEIA
jgi:hypothetical protein